MNIHELCPLVGSDIEPFLRAFPRAGRRAFTLPGEHGQAVTSGAGRVAESTESVIS